MATIALRFVKPKEKNLLSLFIFIRIQAVQRFVTENLQ
jgi:hypothetical protein